MAHWFDDLNGDAQKVVTQRWGSKEFADWTASLLISGGRAALLRTGLSKEERDRFNYMLMQRRIVSMQPGHQPDLVERLYNALHERVASVVDKIDSRTGRHGTAAVQWLDKELQELQADMLNIYKRLTN